MLTRAKRKMKNNKRELEVKLDTMRLLRMCGYIKGTFYLSYGSAQEKSQVKTKIKCPSLN